MRFGIIDTHSVETDWALRTAGQRILIANLKSVKQIKLLAHLGELAILPAPDAEQVAHNIALLLPVQLRDVLVRPHPRTDGKRRL